MVLYVCMYVCTYVRRSTSFMGTNSSSVCGDPTLATPTNVARDYTPPQLFLRVCTYVHWRHCVMYVRSHLVPHYLAGLLRMAGMYVLCMCKQYVCKAFDSVYCVCPFMLPSIPCLWWVPTKGHTAVVWVCSFIPAAHRIFLPSHYPSAMRNVTVLYPICHG